MSSIHVYKLLSHETTQHCYTELVTASLCLNGRHQEAQSRNPREGATTHKGYNKIIIKKEKEEKKKNPVISPLLAHFRLEMSN